VTAIADLRGSRELLINLTLRELRSKYKRSVLGWTWSLLNPLATMIIFTIVFSKVIGVKAPPGDPSGLNVFALFLLCGLLPWNYLSNSINGGATVLVINGNLIKKVYFPRETLVASNTASWLFSLAIELGVLLVALLLVGNMIIPWLPILVILVAIQTMFVLGVALLVSVLNVYFRDTQHLLAIALLFWFYATPIVYPITLVHQNLSTTWYHLYQVNPMVEFVGAYRDILYDLRWPSAASLAYLLLVSVATLAFGYAVFRRLEPKLAEEL
jgi:ABC-2 type transport system permease protein